jgi:signal peptidase I
MRSEQIWARVLASFLVPGLGQALTGRRMRAIVWAIVGLASVVAIGWTIWLLYLGVVVRLASAADAYWCTRRPASGPLVFVIASSILGGLGLVYFLIGFEGVRAPSTSMLPTIAQDDKLYVDMLSGHVRDYARGEVIVFRQPCSPDREYVKRIVAVGGDTIEVRCGIVYVNGKAVPAELVAADVTYFERDEDGHRHQRRVSHYRETVGGKTYEIYDEPERPERHDQRSHKEYPSDRAPSCADATDPDAERNAAQPELTVTRTKERAGACEPWEHVVVPPNTLFVMGDCRDNSNDSRYWGVVPVELVVGRVVGIRSPLGRISDL